MSKKKSKKVAEAGEKDENNDHKEQKEQKKGGGGGGEGGKKEGNGNPLILKLDLHCEGCASKVARIVKGFEGVETVKIDCASGKCAVTGKVDPVKLQEKLEQKTHKKVELLTPVPKKDQQNTKSKDESGDAKEEKKKDKDDKSKDKNSNEKNKDEKNAKQLPIVSAMLKVPLHCDGCIQKIYKIVSKTKGYEEMKVEKQSDAVMVKGAMDMKALAETLKKHLKRNVEIVQPKKDEKKEKEKGKEKEKEKKGKGEDEGHAAASGGEGGVQDIRETMEGNKMQVQQFNYGYGYPSPHMYVPSYVGNGGGGGDGYYQYNYHAPQMFSDENPNACSIM